MRAILTSFALLCAQVMADNAISLVDYSYLEIPVTPFSNMASGYQATNPGFRAVLRDENGEFVGGGEMSMDAVIRGTTDDASKGSAYGKLVLRVELESSSQKVAMVETNESHHGKLSICMAQDTKAPIAETKCKNLIGNIHPERPFQWLDKSVEYKIHDGRITITKYHGYVGEGGTREQLALAVYHPAFGFAAPGKAFKDYQSPLVLDLDGNGQLDLINAWDKERIVRFDLTGTGKKVRTGWVNPNDGLLFIDDGSGCVKNGTQLLGEFTNSKDGKKTFENGFEALRALFDKNHQNRIDVKQAPSLKIWRNWGADGICRPSEVYPASKWVKTIELQYMHVREDFMNEDNEVRLIGKFIRPDNSEAIIADVWFKQRWNDGAGLSPEVSENPQAVPVSSRVTNRRSIQVSDLEQLKSYGVNGNYFTSTPLHAGLKVAYSASYGLGGEAGQANGVLVEKDGKLWFKQLKNPTQQLMLPPGMPLRGKNETSLWDFTDYVQLIQRVVSSESVVYEHPAAALVDFSGGTSGFKTSYQDALEVVFHRQVSTRSEANVKIYYAKNVGPVALEFQESMSPGGTFKVYLGE